jgi:hypothetical protein
MAIRVVRAGRRQVPNVNTFVGEKGVVFYDEDTGTLRLSDGVTPGGINNVMPIATSTQVGGIKAGAGVNITSEGEITIDVAGLPVGFGDFYAFTDAGPTGANAAWLSSVITNQDIVLSSNGTGSVNVEGKFAVYPTDGPLNTRTPIFSVDSDGQVQMLVPTADSVEGAVTIVGGLDGVYQPPVNSGVMLHITGIAGAPGVPSRIYNDAQNAFSAFVSRRYNGTAVSPTAVLANEEILRISGTAHNGTLIPGTNANQRIVYRALGNQTSSNQGGVIEFWTTPLNSTTLTQVANIDNANGFTVTKATVTGNITVGNISASGFYYSNGSPYTPTGTSLVNGNSNVLVVANGNVSVSAIGTANVVVVANTGTAFNGNISYSTATGDAGTVTQLNSKTDAVTANGRTGRIVSNAASLSQNTSVTFTVNNNYVAANDVVILNLKSGATANSYNYQVAAVNNNSFQIQLRNFTNGALAEALTFNFAVIKVG